ncbi:MAG TPA: cytidine deaminase [Anaeromyxobacter sp.]
MARARSTPGLAPLVRAAVAARRHAHAPYSRFKVGAAVLAGAAVHAGANVENASYGLTLCAERVAVGAAIVAGARGIDAVAVASGTEEPIPPCGACLQTLAEFAGPELPVVLVGARGRKVETTLGALLPQAFSNRFLV